MLRLLALSLCLLTIACHIEVGDLPPDRVALHEKNATDCAKTPQLCHNGVPW